MQVHWWSLVWALICMPAKVLLISWAVSANSTTEISCLMFHPDPRGVYLHRGFHGNKDVMFLQINNGQVTKETTSVDFKGRIRVSRNSLAEGGNGITWQLSQLRLEDTNWYYCQWVYFRSTRLVTNTSIGTIIVVREDDPQKQCGVPIWRVAIVSLATAAVVVLLFLIGVAIFKCTRVSMPSGAGVCGVRDRPSCHWELQFKREFVPARAASPARPARHQCRCTHHVPYLSTSVDSVGFGSVL